MRRAGEARAKAEKVAEAKRLTASISAARAELNKYEEQLDDSRRGRFFCLFFGLLFGLLFGLFFGLFFGLLCGLTFGLFFGLLFRLGSSRAAVCGASAALGMRLSCWLLQRVAVRVALVILPPCDLLRPLLLC